MSLKENFYNKMRVRILRFDKIIRYVPKKGKILDFGCSYGTFSFLMNKENKNIKITGIDLNADRIRKAKFRARKSKNLEFIAGDVTRMEWENTYDAVTCIDVFHHIPRTYHEKLLKNIFGLIKKNGILILKDMNTRPAYKYYWNFLHDMIMTHSKRMWYTSMEDFQNLLKKQGFKIETGRDISNSLYAHYLIVAVKP